MYICISGERDWHREERCERDWEKEERCEWETTESENRWIVFIYVIYRIYMCIGMAKWIKNMDTHLFLPIKLGGYPMLLKWVKYESNSYYPFKIWVLKWVNSKESPFTVTRK